MVTLKDETGRPYETRTTIKGRFIFDDLSAGTYAMEARSDDIGSATFNIFVVAGETATPTVKMVPGSVRNVIDVTVQGKSFADRMRQSTRAVHVVELTNERRETADLGEVLARNQGISVRRSGGLGASGRISLNGLIDDQIRFFWTACRLNSQCFKAGS